MHESVLLQESVAALVTDPEGVYVDGTFGRGGHSRKILDGLGNKGRLLAVDRDQTALAEAQKLMNTDSRFEFVQTSFAHLPAVIHERGLEKVSGMLLDLGVSSPQIDDPERGFSFRHDGPLDMRMDTGSGESAAEWLARVQEAELAGVLREYGEERFHRRIARAIVEARTEAPITGTSRLADIVSAANPSWEKHKHPATRSFQAIRIFINRELDELRSLLDASLDELAPGGRLVVISFHSLEDRMVKRFIRRMCEGDPIPSRVPVMESQRNRRMRAVGRAVRASSEELAHNQRARSAVMRVAEKLC